MKRILKIIREVKSSPFKNLRLKIFFYKTISDHSFYIRAYSLIWKDKFYTPRFEYNPRIIINLYWLGVVVEFTPPFDILETNEYWEQYLWWKEYSNCDLKKAKDTWEWVDYDTGKSTWNDKYLK